MPSSPLASQNKSQEPVIPQSNPMNTHITGWDTFEHILMFITLYVVSISLALVLYSLVDKWFPGLNPSLNRFSSGFNTSQADSLRWYLALLIVSYPLFAFFFLNVTKRTIANPLLRNIDIRKILIYLTLFVTFIIMFYNVFYTVYSFLNGNIYPNFLLHLATTLGISGTIFVYFAYQVREDRKLNE